MSSFVIRPVDQQRITTAFNLCDLNGDGELSHQELKFAFAVMKCESHVDVMLEQLREMGITADHPVSYPAFVGVMSDILSGSRVSRSTRSSGGPRAPLRFAEELDERLDNLIELREAFDSLDSDGSGELERDELGPVLEALGRNVTDSELDTMLMLADLDGSGAVSWTNLLQAMADGKLETVGFSSAFVIAAEQMRGDVTEQSPASAEGAAEAVSTAASATSAAELEEVAATIAANVAAAKSIDTVEARRASQSMFDARDDSMREIFSVKKPRPHRLPSVYAPHFTPNEALSCAVAFDALPKDADGKVDARLLKSAVRAVGPNNDAGSVNETGYPEAIIDVDDAATSVATLSWVEFLDHVLSERLRFAGVASGGGGAPFLSPASISRTTALGSARRAFAAAHREMSARAVVPSAPNDGTDECDRSEVDRSDDNEACESGDDYDHGDIISLQPLIGGGKYTARLRYAQLEVLVRRPVGQKSGIELKLDIDTNTNTDADVQIDSTGVPLLVTNVESGSAAAGDVHIGDYLLAINDRSVHGMRLKEAQYLLDEDPASLSVSTGLGTGMGGMRLVLFREKHTTMTGAMGASRERRAGSMRDRVRRLTQPLLPQLDVDEHGNARGAIAPASESVASASTDVSTPRDVSSNIVMRRSFEQFVRARRESGIAIGSENTGSSDKGPGICISDAKSVLRWVGLEAYAEALFEFLDHDRDGLIHQAEFCTVLQQAIKAERFPDGESNIACGGYDSDLESITQAETDTVSASAGAQRSRQRKPSCVARLARLSPALLMARLRDLDAVDAVFSAQAQQHRDKLISQQEALDAAASIAARRKSTKPRGSAPPQLLHGRFVEISGTPEMLKSLQARDIITEDECDFLGALFAAPRGFSDSHTTRVLPWSEFVEGVCCRRRYSSRRWVDTVREIFEIFDHDCDGRLSVSELAIALAACHNPGSRARSEDDDAPACAAAKIVSGLRVVHSAAAQCVFQTLDVAEDGSLSMFEFVNGIAKYSNLGTNQQRLHRHDSCFLGMHVRCQPDAFARAGGLFSRNRQDMKGTAMLALSVAQLNEVVSTYDDAWSVFQNLGRSASGGSETSIERSQSSDAVSQLAERGTLDAVQAAVALRLLLGSAAGELTQNESNNSYLHFGKQQDGTGSRVPWKEFVAAVFNCQYVESSDSLSPQPVEVDRTVTVAEDDAQETTAALVVESTAKTMPEPAPRASSPTPAPLSAPAPPHAERSQASCSAEVDFGAEDRVDGLDSAVRGCPSPSPSTSPPPVPFEDHAMEDEKYEVLLRCIKQPKVLVGWTVELPHFGQGLITEMQRVRDGMVRHTRYVIRFDSGMTQTLPLDRNSPKEGTVVITKSGSKQYKKLPFMLINRSQQQDTATMQHSRVLT